MMALWSRLAANYEFLRARIAVERPAVRSLIHAIRAQNLTYVSTHKMKRCALALDLVRYARVPGSIIEAGVALGGTAILLAQLRPSGRPLRLYDVFGMIPPPGPSDEDDARRRYESIRGGKASGINGDDYYGYRNDLVFEVKKNLRRFGVEPDKQAIELIPGTFEDRLHVSEPVAFAHIDCDWYQSVVICIERIFPHLSPGGIMVFDDYKSYAGCKKAVDKFIAGRSDVEILFAEQSIGIRKLDTAVWCNQ